MNLSRRLLSTEKPAESFSSLRRKSKEPKGHAKNFVIGDDGEKIVGSGVRLQYTYKNFKAHVDKIENPYVWTWYPWRAHPEHPKPALPCPRALKNLHGAVIPSLTPNQKRIREGSLYKGIPQAMGQELLQDRFTQSHPFLHYIISSAAANGKRPMSFPFWYKKYPTVHQAYENRFAVPSEMLEGYGNPELTRAFSFANMKENEKTRAEVSALCERYCPTDHQRKSTPATCIRIAIRVREIRNHLLLNPKNHVYKMLLGMNERRLEKEFRKWRKLDFRAYWEFIREHELLDICQPDNVVKSRWGMWWRTEWRLGHALSRDIADYIDPRGLMGCVETGRSHSEVARDLGLNYTRTLTTGERKYFHNKATYFERLQKFKFDHVEQTNEKARIEALSRAQALYQKRCAKNLVVDPARKFHKGKPISMLRWKSKRHGPQ
ncbi:tetracenomycin polyketide synthesis O-methyltransferase TcmP [Perkinsela sp. CCAP 1560/4]|nr:tetracenomycin polyketide synthesis O-methyltransferase TcmP [Perkinsela sp. CCAP 1560/4]|eukprot:KNH05443.1 tetracenomycin polyketide synthesis O-methyltransferase TcmP [Perkinsela sp. CCAP 1560/4]